MKILAPRHLMMWPIQLAEFTLALAVTAAVFTIAGGDWHHPIATFRPLITAGLALLGFGLITCLAEYECRTTERRAADQRQQTEQDEIRHRLDSPYGLTVAERAVLGAALQVHRAQLPAEHPQYANLRDAVDMLARSIDRGERVHRDTLKAYQRITQGVRTGRGRAAVEQIVRQHGPISVADIVDRLAIGGSWGPPIDASAPLVRFVLRDPHDRTAPAAWLAPRRDGEPYQHRDNITAPV